MGTPDFSVPTLEALSKEDNLEIVAVYTQPPRPKGRHYELTLSPVHEKANALGLPVLFPASLKSPEEHQTFDSFQADVAVVAAYGLLLPKAILESPRLGCFNVHASLLPRWRGASPIQSALLKGDPETGITIMKMNEKLDEGDMVLQEKIPLTSATTFETLHNELALLGAKALIKALNSIFEGHSTFTPQDHAEATYAPKLSKDVGKIVWDQNAEDIERMIRAFNPWPGVWFEWKTEKFKVLKASPVKGTSSSVGTVLPQEGLVVQCGKGTALSIEIIQKSGKKALPVKEFLNGFPVKAGEVFL